MRVGVPKEIKPDEHRVGLTPAAVREFTARGHEVLVETGAGAGIGAADEVYVAAGARLEADAEAVFAGAELIIKVKEPQPTEWARLTPKHILFTYLHLAPDPAQTEGLIASGCAAIAYETVTDEAGGLPLLAPMSEVAGRLAIEAAAQSLRRTAGGTGLLIGGVPGVPPARILVIGGGVVGLNALRMAVGMGAEVVVLDRSLPRLRALDDLFQGRVVTGYSTLEAIEREAGQADAVIGAVLVAGARAPRLVTRQMLGRMKPGSVLVDVAIDQGGCFEMSRPTTHADPTFVVDGVTHYCVANMPGAVPRTSSYALGNATLPFGLALADGGLESLRRDPHLRNGLNVLGGRLTNAAVAESLGLAWTSAEAALAQSARQLARSVARLRHVQIGSTAAIPSTGARLAIQARPFFDGPMPDQASAFSASASSRALAKRVTGPFIEGRIAAAASGDLLDVFDPATEELIAKIPESGEGDVEAAVASAHRAFEDGRWSGLRPADRERILLKFADLVEAEAGQLAEIESWNQGKSINIARGVDAGASVEFMRYFAGLATKITGHTLDLSIALPPGARHNAYTRREPVGVVAGIAPWNFPMLIGLWKVMPALAAGCTIVLKPSEITPLTSYRLAELALEAGVPPGVFNLVHGRGSVTGRALVSHPLISKISFTGSTAAGRDIAHIAADSFKRLTLELGGKNPAVVLKDADLAKAVPGLLAGALFNGGQVCAAASRIYVERPLYEPLLEAMSGAVAGMSFGPGLDPAAQVNPLVSATHRDRVAGHIDAARKSGATVLSGAAAPDRGYYISPTFVTGALESPIHRTEVFGPVVSVIPVESANEAVAKANDSAYGLAASLWTESLSEAMRLIPAIKAGTVWVNNHVPIDPNLPFGGFKQSGVGRDFGPNSLDAYTEVKSVCITY